MIGILLFTAAVLALLKWRKAPASLTVGTSIGGVAFAAMIGITDPATRPDTAALIGWARALAILGLIAIPILAYALLVRRLKQRNAPPKPKAPAHPTGFVLIEDDAALTQEALAKLIAANRKAFPSERQEFSIAHRDEAGKITASGRVNLHMGLAEFRRIWVEPEARGTGLGSAILKQMEAEAVSRGATRAALDTFSWQAEGFYTKLGYTPYARLAYPAGPERISLQKDLA